MIEKLNNEKQHFFDKNNCAVFLFNEQDVKVKLLLLAKAGYVIASERIFRKYEKCINYNISDSFECFFHYT